MQRASPCAPQAQLRALELDELDAGLIQLSRRGGGGAVAELRGFGQHTLAVARAAVADCERCAAAGGVRELQSRWRALLLGLPAAAVYAAVAQQSQTEAALANQGCPLGPESDRGPAAHLAKKSCGGTLPLAQTRRFAWPSSGILTIIALFATAMQVAAAAMLGHLLLLAAVLLRLMARRHGPGVVVPARAPSNTSY